MSVPRVVVFDLDDTLISWRAAQQKALAAICGRPVAAGVVPEELAEVLRRAVVDDGLRLNQGLVSWDDWQRDLERSISGRLSLPQAQAAGIWSGFRDAMLSCARAHADTAVLGALASTFTLGVATNGPASLQSAKLAATGLLPHFSFVLCSADIGVCKPEPRYFRSLIELAQTEPQQIVMVGNNVYNDLIPAHDAGMHGVFVDRGDFGPQKATWLRHSVRSLSELPPVMEAIWP